MTRQARSSAVVMGLDTHMILETVPVLPANARTCIRPSTGHHTTMPGPWGDTTQAATGRGPSVAAPAWSRPSWFVKQSNWPGAVTRARAVRACRFHCRALQYPLSACSPIPLQPPPRPVTLLTGHHLRLMSALLAAPAPALQGTPMSCLMAFNAQGGVGELPRRLHF
jgi:hypothetical protein